MRAVLILWMTLGVISAQVFARNQDWGNVQKLKPGTKIAMALWAENPVTGRFVSATSGRIRVRAGDRGGTIREFTRESVRSVVHLRGPRLEDPDKWLRNGALIGVAGALIIGLVRDAKGEAGAGANWLVDGAAGAGLGFFGGCVAAGVKGILAAFRHDKLVYWDERPASSFPELRLPK